MTTHVIVILEHDGFGEQATPVAVIAVDPVEDVHRIRRAWLGRNGYDYRMDADGNMVWVKTTSGLYGARVRYAVATNPMTVEEI